MNSPGIIRTTDDIRAGVAHLRRVCPVMRAIHERTGDPPLRRYDDGLEGLARIVTGQQLSIASAAAIWGRVAGTLAPMTPQRLLGAEPSHLASLGLSAAKIRTLKAVATAIASGELDLATLADATDAQVRSSLTAVHGIGPWTADIYILFCLGRADAWASGDLALQVGAAQALGVGTRLTAAALEQAAERWRPWRGVAAGLIWADYADRRRRERDRPNAEAAAALAGTILSRIRKTP